MLPFQLETFREYQAAAADLCAKHPCAAPRIQQLALLVQRLVATDSEAAHLRELRVRAGKLRAARAVRAPDGTFLSADDLERIREEYRAAGRKRARAA